MKCEYGVFQITNTKKSCQITSVRNFGMSDLEICKICEKMADSPKLIYSLIKDPGKKSAQQEAEDMFRIYDKNKDGFISHDELKEVLSIIGVNFTDIEIKEMMDTFDTDGDGQINFEEYQAMRTLMDQRFVKFQNLYAHYFYYLEIERTRSSWPQVGGSWKI